MMNKNLTQKFYEDAMLFLSFVNKVKVNKEKRRNSDSTQIPKKKNLKIRFKSLNSDVGNFMFYNNIPIIENNTEYTCTYCGAKYVYKRCLVNHMIKNHRNKLL